MYPSKQVEALRKAGKLEEALVLGVKALDATPNDKYLKGAIAWVHWAFLKRETSELRPRLEKGEKLAPRSAESLREHLRGYAALRLPIPDMAFGQIAKALGKGVGRHLDSFVPFLGWAGLRAFDPAAFEPYKVEGDLYPSAVTQVAREALAWIDQRPFEFQRWSPFVLELAGLALGNNKEPTDHLIWVRKDRARLFRHLGRLDEAAAEMREVLRSKRREYWAWQQIAEIEKGRAPALAIACYAQAMLCRPAPEYTGRLHLNFGELLHQHGDYSAAVAEYLASEGVYRKNGWPLPDALIAVLQATWFDASRANSDQERFYRSCARAALRLTYEKVIELNASFIEEESITRNDGKVRTFAHFSVDTDGRQERLRARWQGPRPRALHPGAPFRLTVGVDGAGVSLLEASPRADGEPWDCLRSRDALVEFRSKDGLRIGLYLSRDEHAVLFQRPREDRPTLRVGDAVQVLVCREPTRNGELYAYRPRLLTTPLALDGVETRRGKLRLNAKGFGFVEDVYVPHDLVALPLDGRNVAVSCVKSFDTTKQRWSWKAVRLTEEAEGSSTSSSPSAASPTDPRFSPTPADGMLPTVAHDGDVGETNDSAE